MFNTKSAKFTIDKRYDLNFTFYKIAVHINSCLSDIEYDAFDIGEFGILFCFQRK